MGKLHTAIEKLEKEKLTLEKNNHSPLPSENAQDWSIDEALEESMPTGYLETQISPNLVAFHSPQSFSARDFNRSNSVL